MRLIDFVQTRKQKGEKLFVAYLTAGDPNFAKCRDYLHVLCHSGVDILELGVAHNDPTADGPTIQRACERALNSHASLEKVLDFIAELREEGLSTPIVLFSYLNPLLAFGLERFAKAAQKSGIDGVLVVDLPVEEAQDFYSLLRKANIAPVCLLSPTTTDERIQAIDAASSGFVYYVSRLGTTGATQSLSDSLSEELTRVKRLIRNPLCVGFGISTASQAARIIKQCDGAVIGSAFIEHIEAGHSHDTVLTQLAEFARELGHAIHSQKGERKC